MAWEIEYDKEVAAEVAALSPEVAIRILDKVRDHLALAPKSLGQGMGDRFSGFWKYRVGKWRVIYSLDEAGQVLTVYRVGLRDRVYKRPF